jgi:hypothetical protein
VLVGKLQEELILFGTPEPPNSPLAMHYRLAAATLSLALTRRTGTFVGLHQFFFETEGSPSLLVLLGPPHIRHLARNCFPIHAFHRPPHALAAPRSLRSDSEFRHQLSQRLVFFLRKMALAQTRIDVSPPAVQHSVVQGRRGARM